MIFQRPRKLPHGKELLRTEKFTLIYLGAGNLHYSFIGEKGLVYGDIDFKRNRFKVIPLLTLATLITSYLVLGTNPTSAMIEPEEILQEEIVENDERDKLAKNADENYLKQTEQQKLAIIKSSDSVNKAKYISYRVKETDTVQSIASDFNVTPEAIREASNLKSGDAYCILGDCLLKQFNANKAITYYQKAVALYDNIYGNKNVYSIDALIGLSNSYIQIGDFKKALSFAQIATSYTIKNNQIIFPYDHWETQLQALICKKELYKTKPTKASKEKRLQGKRVRSEVKKMRRSSANNE